MADLRKFFFFKLILDSSQSAFGGKGRGVIEDVRTQQADRWAPGYWVRSRNKTQRLGIM